MANVLVFTETSGDNVKSVTLEILGKLGQPADVVAVNELSDNAKSELAKYGAEKYPFNQR